MLQFVIIVMALAISGILAVIYAPHLVSPERLDQAELERQVIHAFERIHQGVHEQYRAMRNVPVHKMGSASQFHRYLLAAPPYLEKGWSWELKQVSSSSITHRGRTISQDHYRYCAKAQDDQEMADMPERAGERVDDKLRQAPVWGAQDPDRLCTILVIRSMDGHWRPL